MPNNFLITGAPRSGKTTVIEKVTSRLQEGGFKPGGIYCPEIRSDGKRMGFKIVDVMTEESKVLAHVDMETGPSVGKYRVNVPNIDDICETAFENALREADFIIVDEIAPMEVHSEVFKSQVQRSLNVEKPLIAAIHKQSTSGFIGEVKRRDDIKTFEVTEKTRNEIPERVAGVVSERL